MSAPSAKGQTMLRVNCTHCGKTIRCPPERVGDEVVCPHCQAHFVVSADSSGVDKSRANEPRRTAQPPEPPAPDEASPATLGDLIRLQTKHHAEICQRLDQSHADMQTVLGNIAKNARGTRWNTLIIGILFLALALPILAISACGMMTAATSPSAEEILQQQLQGFSDDRLEDLLK